MDCENCRYLTVVGLHDTGPRSLPENSARVRRKVYVFNGIFVLSVERRPEGQDALAPLKGAVKCIWKGEKHCLF